MTGTGSQGYGRRGRQRLWGKGRETRDRETEEASESGQPAAKAGKNTDTQTEKHRELLATLIPFGQSPAYMKGGSGKENKTSWKV